QRAELFQRPGFHDRSRQVPDIELRVNGAAEALDMHQRFQQQDVLHRRLDMVLARGVEQLEHQRRELEPLKRLRQHRADNFLDGALEAVAVHRHRGPAGAHHDIDHAGVVVAHHHQCQATEYLQVFARQTPDNGAVHRHVLRRRRILRRHENIAGMHVGVEEVEVEYLLEKDFHATLGQQTRVNAGGLDALDIVDRNAVDALGHHDTTCGQVAVYFRDKQQRAEQEVAAHGLGIPGFRFQVQFGADDVGVIIDHARRAEIARVAPQAFEPARAEGHYAPVAGNNLLDARANHLDHDFAAIFQRGRMYLGHRGGGERHDIETAKQLAHWCAEL